MNGELTRRPVVMGVRRSLGEHKIEIKRMHVRLEAWAGFRCRIKDFGRSNRIGSNHEIEDSYSEFCPVHRPSSCSLPIIGVRRAIGLLRERDAAESSIAMEIFQRGDYSLF